MANSLNLPNEQTRLNADDVAVAMVRTEAMDLAPTMEWLALVIEALGKDYGSPAQVSFTITGWDELMERGDIPNWVGFAE